MTAQGQSGTVETVFNPPLEQPTRRNTCQRKRPEFTHPSLIKLHQKPPTGKPILPGRKEFAPTSRTIQKTKPHTPTRGNRRNQNGATSNFIQNQNTRRNLNAGRNLVDTLIASADRNLRWGSNTGWNSNTRGNRNLARNSNHQQPNTDYNKVTALPLEVADI